MAADTLTDAQVEVLRAYRDGRLIADCSRNQDYWWCWDRGLTDGRGLTSAGREALARHEETNA